MNWEEIVNDFKNGMSVNALSKKYDTSYRKIDAYLINNGYKVIKRKMSDKKIQEVITAILDKKHLCQIQLECNVSRETIKNIAKENNIKIEKYTKARSDKNKNFNDDYFSVIDTEEKAYFLGFIYSDGNVREHNGGYFLNMELKREDRYILEKLASELRCENTIYDRNRKTNFGESNMSSFTSCNSKKMFDDLARFNIVPNKSHTTCSFTNIENLIPNNLIKHFLRGLIDGDGTISKRYTTNQNAIAVYQNEIEFCHEFDRLLKKSMNDDTLFDNIIINKHTGVYNLRYRRINDVIKICNHLYGDASIYLKRKYKLAKLYFDSYLGSRDCSLLLCANE